MFVYSLNYFVDWVCSSRTPRSQVSRPDAPVLGCPTGVQRACSESPWLTPSSLCYCYFLKDKKWHLLSFHSFALPELENLFSVYQSLSLFLFLICVFTFIAYLCLESGIFLAYFMRSYIWRLDIFLTVSIFWKWLQKICICITNIFILSFFFLDSSFFGFCETDLQGASKSSGMLFYIILNLSFIFMPSLFQRVERIIGRVLILQWGMFRLVKI